MKNVLDKEIFKPHHNPNKNWVKDIDPRTMDSNIKNFFANNLLEQRLHDLFTRYKMSKKSKQKIEFI